MPYYGIPSAGLALTASTANDTVAMANLGGTTLTANSLYGADGNDIISIGAVGRTAVATASVSTGTLGGQVQSGTLNLSAQLIGSATYSASTILATGIYAGSIAVTGVITSQQAARVVNGTLIQGNAGNDSILLGNSLQRVSASTFAGGAGNDWIAAATNVNNQVTTVATALSAAVFISSRFEGGDGNDTIYLAGSAEFSALNINANQGNDLVDFRNALIQGGSFIGLGDGNDELSGLITSFTTSTIAGGKGNDTIILQGVTNTNVMIGGDRANNDNQTADGNDSIFLNGTTLSAIVYGGGGNDTLTWSGVGGSANVVSLNAGNDAFTAQLGSLFLDGTLGFGEGNDILDFADSARIVSSTINLGNGKDSTYFADFDLGSGNLANTTLNGGAGNDLLLASGTLSAGATVAPVIGYNANSESTISAFDTVALAIAAGRSGTYAFRYEVGGASLASFSATDGKLTGSNGLVTFTSNFASDVTSRAEAVAANTTTGNTSVFLDGSGITYMFVKGSSDNLIVQVGTAAVSGGLNDAVLSIGAGKNITLNLG
jgi:hypothetical protein